MWIIWLEHGRILHQFLDVEVSNDEHGLLGSDVLSSGFGLPRTPWKKYAYR
jgi:hypothetical protein